MMQIFLAGAEVSSHLAAMRSCGVTRVAVSITNLARTVTDLEHWATRERLEGLEWVLYADSPSVPAGPALEVLKGAEVQPEIVTGPITWYEGTWLANTDLLFLPIWDATDPTVLRDFTSNYDGVTLPDSVVDNPTAVRQARASINRLGQLAALTGRSKGIERFDTLVSSAWYAVQKYGETQVWATNRLVRLNAEDKRLKRERYAPAITELGLDLDKILADEPSETIRLAIMSWLSLEQHLSRGNTTPSVSTGPLVTNPGSIRPDNVVTLPTGVANGGAQGRHHLLPVIGPGTTTIKTTDEAGNEIEEHIATIQVNHNVLRRCDTCVLAIGCPGFQSGADCSFNIPVTIQSKPQLFGVIRAVAEIQAQRVLMGRFSEEIRGEHDPDLGKEMDRFMSIVERWRNIEDTRDTVKLSLEAKGDAKASMGVISRLFGAQAGQNATLLAEPVDSDEIIDELTEE